MFDYHVHTSFSADSTMPMNEACKSAIDKGITQIAFTEHLDLFYPNCELDFTFNYGDYAASVDRMRDEYGAKLTVLKAVEVGIHPFTYEQSKSFTDRNAFDFVIGSVHIVDDLDLHNGDYFHNKNAEQSLQMYFETVARYVKEYADFNVLGHLTLIKRYLHYAGVKWQELDWEPYGGLIDDIFRTLIQTGRGIEVNMSGYRYNIDCPLPKFEMVKRYRELGGEIITLGSDAHIREHIGTRNREGYDLIKEAGFRHIAVYKDRKPSFVPVP